MGYVELVPGPLIIGGVRIHEGAGAVGIKVIDATCLDRSANRLVVTCGDHERGHGSYRQQPASAAAVRASVKNVRRDRRPVCGAFHVRVEVETCGRRRTEHRLSD